MRGCGVVLVWTLREFSALRLPLVTPSLLVFVVFDALLKRTDHFRRAELVCLVVTLRDELSQRCLPWTSFGVREAPELLWIEPKFSGHLHRGMR